MIIKILKYVIATIGCIFAVFGFIGIFIPIVPATPFLLLSLTCFSYASPKLYKWLITRPHLGPLLRVYIQHRIIPKSIKVLTTIAAWCFAGYFIFVKDFSKTIDIVIACVTSFTIIIIFFHPSKAIKNDKNRTI